MFVALTGFKSQINQDVIVLVGVYDGHEDYGYNFIYEDENQDERTKTFQEINEDVLEKFDLDSEVFLGKKFEITYTFEMESQIDEDGNEDENEINTITGLKVK
jgi:hypothetical protein